MSISSYEGPRDGDYVRYVDAMLRSSVLYRASAQALKQGSRSDFTSSEALTPGAQPASAWERLREQALAAVEQAQREAQERTQGTQPGGQRKQGRGRQGQTQGERAARREARKSAPQAMQQNQVPEKKKSRFRITPGHIVLLVILAVIGMAFPGFGAMVLLIAIVNAVRSGIQSAKS
ncbi:MAG: hypothetical protein LBV14_17810 [Acidovorax sp.]|jgi:hypothetical protein|nr:hypothetical protein [Acidovorax sp.]